MSGLVFSSITIGAMQRDDTLLSRFPKQRPELPEAFRKIYVEHYKRNREGGSPAPSLSQKMESWMHRKVAEDVARSGRQCRTLGIGAGNLNHLQYEPASGPYGVVESLADLVAGSAQNSRVANVYRNLSGIG